MARLLLTILAALLAGAHAFDYFSSFFQQAQHGFGNHYGGYQQPKYYDDDHKKKGERTAGLD